MARLLSAIALPYLTLYAQRFDTCILHLILYSPRSRLQPGSTVATSLTEGEAAPKNAFWLQIRGDQFRTEPLPLRCVMSPRKYV